MSETNNKRKREQSLWQQALEELQQQINFLIRNCRRYVAIKVCLFLFFFITFSFCIYILYFVGSTETKSFFVMCGD